MELGFRTVSVDIYLYEDGYKQMYDVFSYSIC